VHTVSYRRVLKSALYFNLRHFLNRSSNRLLRSNAKSTQSIQPQMFAASESVSYPAISCPAFSCLQFHILQFHALYIGPSISCPAISCPANWSINFTSVIFTSSIFSAPINTSTFSHLSWKRKWFDSALAEVIINN